LPGFVVFVQERVDSIVWANGLCAFAKTKAHKNDDSKKPIIESKKFGSFIAQNRGDIGNIKSQYQNGCPFYN